MIDAEYKPEFRVQTLLNWNDRIGSFMFDDLAHNLAPVLTGPIYQYTQCGQWS
jgi:hypothetical protein